MTKNYLKKFIKYVKKIYHIEDGLKALRDTLKVIDNQGIYKMHSKIIKKAKRNKVLEKGTIDSYSVVAIDGTKLFMIRQPFYDALIW